MLNKDKKHYSYSGIKRFIKEGPISLVTEKNYSNDGMNKGLILEDMLMLSDFEDRYYIAEEDIGTLTSMERKLLDAKVERPEKEYQYLKEDLGYFKGDSENKFQDRVVEIDKFYEGYKESYGKKFIKKDLWSNVFTMSEALKADENTNSYFNNDNISNIQNIYQKTIKFKFEDKEFKCILDIIQIDNANKTIQAVDLKYTRVAIGMFESEFFKYRYDIQACLYSLALTQFIEDNSLDGYKVVEPAYIVVNDNLETCKFIVDNSILFNAWNGYTWNGYKKEGIDDLSRLIKWHIDESIFNMSKEYYDSQYVRLKVSIPSLYGSPSFSNINTFLSEKEKEKNKEIINVLKRRGNRPSAILGSARTVSTNTDFSNQSNYMEEYLSKAMDSMNKTRISYGDEHLQSSYNSKEVNKGIVAQLEDLDVSDEKEL